MRQNIQVKIIYSSGDTISNYVSNFNLPEPAICSDVKNIIKSQISGSDAFTIEREVLYFGNKKLKDEDIVPKYPGAEYNIFIKK